jgi:hypothetical protein
MIPVIIRYSFVAIIKTAHRNYFIDTTENIGKICSIGTRAAGIQFFLFGQHTLRNAPADILCLHPAFFIADGPEKYGWMITVAQDHLSNWPMYSGLLFNKRVSSSTNIPKLSHASSKAGVGGL